MYKQMMGNENSETSSEDSENLDFDLDFDFEEQSELDQETLLRIEEENLQMQ